MPDALLLRNRREWLRCPSLEVLVMANNKINLLAPSSLTDNVAILWSVVKLIDIFELVKSCLPNELESMVMCDMLPNLVVKTETHNLPQPWPRGDHQNIY